MFDDYTAEKKIKVMLKSIILVFITLFLALVIIYLANTLGTRIEPETSVTVTDEVPVTEKDELYYAELEYYRIQAEYYQYQLEEYRKYREENR